MQKKRILLPALLAAAALFSVHAGDAPIRNAQFGVPKWAKNKAVTIQKKGAQSFQVKAKGGAAIAPWNMRAVLAKGTSYSLDGKKVFFITAKLLSGDKPVKASVIVARQCPGDKGEGRFATEIIVNPGEAQSFRIPLRTGGARGKRTGLFVPVQGRQCDLHIESGGDLHQLIFSSSAELEFSDFGFSDQEMDNTPPAGSLGAKLEKQMAAHKLTAPYQFAELIKSDAIDSTDFVIRIPENPGRGEEFAAQELSRYLMRVSGNDFPVVRKSVPGKKEIVLQVVPKAGNDGFAMESTDGKTIRITANNQRAVTYAVYDFLEKAAGCRFLLPFRCGEVIRYRPKYKFPLFRDRSQAAFEVRTSCYCGSYRHVGVELRLLEVNDWLWKNRFNTDNGLLDRANHNAGVKLSRSFAESRGGNFPNLPISGHNISRLVLPHRVFAKTHPEYYAWDKLHQCRRTDGTNPCTSSPAVVKEVAKIADKYFQDYPWANGFPIFQDDGMHLFCQCDACLAQTATGDNRLDRTDNMIAWVNAIGKEIRKKHPDKGISTFSYTVTANPPQKQKPEPFVKIMLCHFAMNGQITYPPLTRYKEALDRISRWCELTNGNLRVRVYNHVPYNTTENIAAEIRALSLLGIREYCSETQQCGAGPDSWMGYLSHRLAWDPWLDVAALRKDYCNKLFGSAGREMEQFLILFEQEACAHKNRFLPPSPMLGLPPEVIAKLQKLLDTAKKKTLKSTDNSAMTAVHFEQLYLDFTAATSAAVRGVQKHRMELTEESYREATRKIEKLAESIRGMVHTELVRAERDSMHYLVGKTSRVLAKDNERRLALEAVRGKYKILAELPKWMFHTDPKGIGEKENWASGKAGKGWVPIRAGDSWENQGFKDYDGYGWYKRSVELPCSGCSLFFLSVDEEAWVYLDGKFIGGQYGGNPGLLWNKPFFVAIPDDVKPGTHTLAVRVHDTSGQGGIWQPVYLVQKKEAK